MSKSDKTTFICQSCGFESPKWLGKCPNCNSWASFVETRPVELNFRSKSKKEPKKTEYLVDLKSRETGRISTKLPELDTVLTGGVVQGQVILLAGEPGIGKSTLLLSLADNRREAMYICGEESVGQIKLRAQRMGLKAQGVAFLDETNIDVVLATFEKEYKKHKFELVIVDSVQTMYTENLTGVPGSVGQVREVTFRLINLAKRNNVPVVLVGHVTKDGTVAGPSTLAHMVDTVLWMEGDKLTTLRVLRSVKNRFGSTDEVGIFQMTEKGLIGASDIDALFLSENEKTSVGSVISCALEGTRPILVEVQSLIVPTKLAFPRRVVHGIDSKKLELIIAILTRHAGLRLSEYDVFVNVVGGIKIKDPAIDLAVALAIASSYKNKPLKGSPLAIGELGLLGEVRRTREEEKRINNAKRQGIAKFISSSSKTIRGAVKAALE
jgi:DNA repair protein RadA/Sms